MVYLFFLANLRSNSYSFYEGRTIVKKRVFAHFRIVDSQSQMFFDHFPADSQSIFAFYLQA